MKRSGCSGFFIFALVVSLTVGTLYIINHPQQQKLGAILPGPVPTLPPGTPPPTTQSIYEFTDDPHILHSQGCQEDKVAPYGLVILDWAAPQYVPGRNEYGTTPWGGPTLTDTDIGKLVESFIQGVWDCRQPTTNFAIGIGTSNSGSCAWCPDAVDPNETQSGWYHAGEAWGNMVNQVQQFITNKGMGGQMVADGADDMEDDGPPDWTNFANTKTFVDGYNVATKQLLFDFGDDTGGNTPVPPWTVDQIWYLAYGAPDDVPLPEIYGEGWAYGWEQVNQWACQNEHGPMRIIGTMDEAPLPYDAPGTHSTDPWLPIGDSWKVMHQYISSDSCTSPMASSLTLSTNIDWIDELCLDYSNCPWTGT